MHQKMKLIWILPIFNNCGIWTACWPPTQGTIGMAIWTIEATLTNVVIKKIVLKKKSKDAFNAISSYWKRTWWLVFNIGASVSDCSFTM